MQLGVCICNVFLNCGLATRSGRLGNAECVLGELKSILGFTKPDLRGRAPRSPGREIASSVREIGLLRVGEIAAWLGFAIGF